MDAVDFVIVRGQQSFDEEKKINPIEIKIENNKIQGMFDKDRKNKVRFSLECMLFSSSITNETKKNILANNGSIGCEIWAGQ